MFEYGGKEEKDAFLRSLFSVNVQPFHKCLITMVATTHSPHLLGLISSTTLQYASLTYCLEGKADARIKRIVDIPEARRVIEQQDLTRLHASRWLEDAVVFVGDEGAAA